MSSCNQEDRPREARTGAVGGAAPRSGLGWHRGSLPTRGDPDGGMNTVLKAAMLRTVMSPDGLSREIDVSIPGLARWKKTWPRQLNRSGILNAAWAEHRALLGMILCRGLAQREHGRHRSGSARSCAAGPEQLIGRSMSSDIVPLNFKDRLVRVFPIRALAS